MHVQNVESDLWYICITAIFRFSNHGSFEQLSQYQCAAHDMLATVADILLSVLAKAQTLRVTRQRYKNLCCWIFRRNLSERSFRVHS